MFLQYFYTTAALGAITGYAVAAFKTRPSQIEAHRKTCTYMDDEPDLSNYSCSDCHASLWSEAPKCTLEGAVKGPLLLPFVVFYGPAYIYQRIAK
jgi:hypothetical protein